MLPYATAFDRFDPKEGYYVEYFNTFFPDISDRARKLLNHRSRDEIKAAALIIDWLINEQCRERMFDALLKDATALDEGRFEESTWPTGPTKELLHCLDLIELDDKEDFPNATAAEFVAVLALCLAGLAYEAQENMKKKGFSGFQSRYWSQTGSFAIEAMEAIVTAEFLTQGDRAHQGAHLVEHAVKHKISLQASRAARKRFEPISRLKHEFINWYGEHIEAGKFHSRAQAAQQFYDSLPPDKKKLLTPSNAQRTLLDALRDSLRGSE
jgi:hypothetical protein